MPKSKRAVPPPDPQTEAHQAEHRNRPISLHPMTFGDAVDKLLSVKPLSKKKTKKRGG